MCDKVYKWYVINLKKDVERWSNTVRLLTQELGVDPKRVVRIDAIEMKPGWKGCTLSHLKAIRKARADVDQDNANNENTLVAILEDDLMCHDTPANVKARIQAALDHFVPDALYLAMTPQRLDDPLIEGLCRVRCSLGAAGTIYRRGMLDRVEQLVDESRHLDRAHDFHMAHHQGSFRAYGFRPTLCRQRPGFSRIEGRKVDYAYLEVDGAMLK